MSSRDTSVVLYRDPEQEQIHLQKFHFHIMDVSLHGLGQTRQGTESDVTQPFKDSLLAILAC